MSCASNLALTTVTFLSLTYRMELAIEGKWVASWNGGIGIDAHAGLDVCLFALSLINLLIDPILLLHFYMEPALSFESLEWEILNSRMECALGLLQQDENV